MRKIIAGLFISVDGVVESPETWQFPYFNDEMGEAVASQAAESDTILLGRRTYQEFAAYWPNQPRDAEFAATMNDTPKLVASRSLRTLGWDNSTLIEGDIATALTRLKEEPGANISIIGSGTLVRSLLHDSVLDELRLLVHPIVVGRGKRLFDGARDRVPLELVSAATFKSGVLSLVYRPSAAA
jgi:dihydrofolate reductase